MSTPDVTMQTRLPSLATGKGVSATIRLVTTSDGTEAWGTWSGGSVGGARTVQADSSGLVTFVDVVPNSLISPSGTYYEIKTQIGHRIITRSIEVPNVAGPLDVDDDDLDSDSTTNLPARVTASDVLPALSGALRPNYPELAGWYTAKQAAWFSTANLARVLLIGDSISVLNNLATTQYRSWAHRTDIAMSQHNTRRLHTSAGWRAASADTAIRGSTSTTGADLETGMGGYAVRLDVGEVVSWTFTGDGYDIARTLGPSDGSIEVRLDGNLVATVSCNGAASATNISSYSTTYASHTVTCTAITAACTVEGAYFSCGNRVGGTSVWNAAHSGYDCADFTATPALGLSAVTQLDPDLVVIALGTNDTAATLEANLLALVLAIRALKEDVSILIVAPYASDADTLANFVTKHNACASVAEDEGCAFISMMTYIGDIGDTGDDMDAASGTELSNDGIHLAMPGEQMLSDLIGAVISGDPAGYLGSMWRAGYRGPRIFDGRLYYTASGAGKIITIDSGTTAGVTLGVTDATSQSLPSASLMSSATATLLGLGSNGCVAFGRSGGLPDVYLSSSAAATLQTNAEVQAKSFSTTGKTGATAAAILGGGVASGAPASGAHVVGEFTVDHTGTLQICTAAGTPGTWVDVRRAATTSASGDVELATAAEVITGTSDSLVSPLSAWASVSMLKPTAALVESFPRAAITTANAATLTTQRMYMVAIGLPKGLDITGIAFLSGTTALSAPTNWWFGILDSSRVALKFTADQLTAAWAANTLMPVALSATHTTTYAGLHYLGIMCKGTVPTLAGTSQANSAINGLTPIIAGLAADTGLTAPPSLPFTAGALTASTPRPYCYVY